MPIKDYSTDPDLNVQISGINIAEGCPPSGINNAIRQLMADVKVESEAQAEAITAAGEALEAFAEGQAAKDEEQDEAIAEAKSSAEAASEDVTALDTTLRTLIVEELAKYLPLSGGVMTGRLEVPSFVVSPGKGEGGQIDLYGGNKEAQRMCSLDTYNNTIRFIQFPSPDGSITGLHVAQFDMANDLLTWAGVARSVKYMGFPLSNYIDVQAENGRTYTAPANGFFSVAASGSNSTGSYLSIENTTSLIGNRSSGSGSLFTSVPMKKGDTIRLNYASINSWFYCCFVYGG